MLAHLIGRLSVKALSSTQLLHELTTQLSAPSLLLTLLIELAQPRMSTSYDKLAKTHTLSTTPQRIKRLMDRRRLGDRMAREASRHNTSVAPSAAPVAPVDASLAARQEYGETGTGCKPGGSPGAAAGGTDGAGRASGATEGCGLAQAALRYSRNALRITDEAVS